MTFHANHQRTSSVEIRRICSGESHESFIDCHVMLQIHFKSSWLDHWPRPTSFTFISLYQLGGVNMFRNGTYSMNHARNVYWMFSSKIPGPYSVDANIRLSSLFYLILIPISNQILLIKKLVVLCNCSARPHYNGPLGPEDKCCRIVLKGVHNTFRCQFSHVPFATGCLLPTVLLAMSTQKVCQKIEFGRTSHHQQ